MAAKAVQLGKDFRLYIGNTATPANDTLFTLIENESNLGYTWTNDVQEFTTKAYGVINESGAERYEITLDLGSTHEDAGYALFATNKGTAWPYQIRQGIKVVLEGDFIATESAVSGEAVGVRTGSISLVSSGEVTETPLGRALTTGS